MRRTRLLGMCVISWLVLCAGFAAGQVVEPAEKAENATSVSQKAEKNGEQASADYSQCSPRATMHKFVTTMEARDFRQAITALDFSQMTPAPDTFQKIEVRPTSQVLPGSRRAG